MFVYPLCVKYDYQEKSFLLKTLIRSYKNTIILFESQINFDHPNHLKCKIFLLKFILIFLFSSSIIITKIKTGSQRQKKDLFIQ